MERQGQDGDEIGKLEEGSITQKINTEVKNLMYKEIHKVEMLGVKLQTGCITKFIRCAG